MNFGGVVQSSEVAELPSVAVAIGNSARRRDCRSMWLLWLLLFLARQPPREKGFAAVVAIAAVVYDVVADRSAR